MLGNFVDNHDEYGRLTHYCRTLAGFGFTLCCLVMTVGSAAAAAAAAGAAGFVLAAVVMIVLVVAAASASAGVVSVVTARVLVRCCCSVSTGFWPQRPLQLAFWQCGLRGLSFKDVGSGSCTEGP